MVGSNRLAGLVLSVVESLNSSTYDMSFRDYNPGLNQFLTRDTYNGALDDQNLATDPFTGNRYAFGAGNFVGTVELDGHDNVRQAFPETDSRPKGTGDGWDFAAGVVNGIAQLADAGILGTNPVAGGMLQSHHATLSDLWARYWKSQGGDTSRSSSYWAGTLSFDVLGSLVGGGEQAT